ncbi:hypothetical protein ABZ119_07155 [Streptomyces sp. NPDC006288]|uniref:hypothetical protein n=1 Tax=Streptomyces sp. NPDC006288 TaxID=3156743 RepID=UPI0033A267D7
MTACAIENNTAGAAGAAATAEPAPGPVEAVGPAEPEKPRAAGTSDEGSDPLRVEASDPDPDRGDAGAPGADAGRGGPAASAVPAEHRRPGASERSAGPGPGAAFAEAAVPPLPPVPPPPPPFPPGPPGGAAAGEAPARVTPSVLTIAADHSYAARLTAADTGAADPAWFPERWTLDGPEPYAVPLPLDQPEEADSDVLPLSDGRVLIRRRVADRHAFSLLYPTGPGTGELPLGALECTDLTLLPPPPDGMSAYALVPGERSTGVWLVAGGTFGPEHVADVAGHCSGGAWLDREGRLLALDRQWPGGGPVKAVAVDLGRGGEVTPLLQIAPDSDDRLLLADADSGLLLIRSDAPGHDRLGWGVLGSFLPVRFPECLHPAGVSVTPVAVQPGQMLAPESCAVALRIDGPAASWVGLWRPSGRRLHQVAAPEGWLSGAGFWSREGTLHLPYARPGAPCAVAVMEAPAEEARAPHTTGAQPSAAQVTPGVCRPVPLGQAPLAGSTAAG